MKAQLEQRLVELKAERKRGLQAEAAATVHLEELRQTLQRIEGAILVLEEELEKAPPPE